MPQNVGGQRALAVFGAGGLVVGDSLRCDQQGGQAVDQSRLARADVAGEQSVLAPEFDRPHLAVEGSPVVGLEPLQPKPDKAIVEEVEFESVVHWATSAMASCAGDFR